MPYTTLSASASRSAVVLDDGRAWVWGNVARRLPAGPDGKPAMLCGPGSVEVGHGRYAQATAQAVRPLPPVRTLVDGQDCLLAITNDATLMACSLLATEAGTTPAARVAGSVHPARAVAAAECATAVLLTNGDVMTWGVNVHGQLGRATALLEPVPGKVEGLPPITQIVAGSNHFLALDRTGQVWAWGANAAGQIGIGGISPAKQPVKVPLPEKITSLAAGETHSLAIDDRGRAWGWGSQHKGQLGLAVGQSLLRHEQPVALRLGFAVSSLDAGMHYSAALSRDGDVFVWGWNGTSQLAAEGSSSSAKPLRVQGLRKVDRLAAGPGHLLAACGDDLYAWGDNRSAACGLPPAQPVVPAPRRITIA